MKHLTQTTKKHNKTRFNAFILRYGTLYANNNKTQTNGKKHGKNGNIKRHKTHGKK